MDTDITTMGTDITTMDAEGKGIEGTDQTTMDVGGDVGGDQRFTSCKFITRYGTTCKFPPRQHDVMCTRHSFIPDALVYKLGYYVNLNNLEKVKTIMEKILKHTHAKEMLKQFDLRYAYLVDRKMFRYLLANGCEYGHLLKYAVAFNDLYLVKKIISEKISVATSIQDIWGDDGHFLLKAACQKGHTWILEYVLEVYSLFGVCPKDTFYYGINRLNIVKILLSYGQSIACTPESFTKLVSSPKVLRYLVGVGHISPAAVDTEGISLIYHALDTCYESFRFLLDTDVHESLMFVVNRTSVQDKILNRYLFKRMIAKYELTYHAKMVLCDKLNVPYADIKKPAYVV